MCFFCASRRRHTRCALVTGGQTCALPILLHWGDATGIGITLFDQNGMRPRRASINGETRRTVANDRLSRGLLDQVPGYLQVLPKLLRREGEHAAVVISMAGD